MAISNDEGEGAEKFAAKLDPWFPLLSDGDLAVTTAYGVLQSEHELALPALFIVDQSGAVLVRRVGEANNDRVYADTLLQLLDEHLGKPGSTAPATE